MPFVFSPSHDITMIHEFGLPSEGQNTVCACVCIERPHVVEVNSRTLMSVNKLRDMAVLCIEGILKPLISQN